MNKQELMQWASDQFKEQMGLELSDILSITDNKFCISSDNRMGLSIGSLKLDLSRDEHGIMHEFLTAIDKDVH